MSFTNRCTTIAVLRTLLVAVFVTFSGGVASADAPATVKPVDLSLPVSPSPKPKRVGLHGGARDLLKRTKPIDPAMSDASQEGKLKNGPTGSLPVLSPGQNQPVYNATSPNLPGDPGVLNH